MDEDGFRIVNDVLSIAECDRLIGTLAKAGVCGDRAGARHLMSVPAIAELANDKRLVEIASQELDSPATSFRATLFNKTAKANWLVAPHQDIVLPLTKRSNAPGWGPWSKKAGVTYANAPDWALRRVIALRVHIDPATFENGPLKVVPGSHVRGLLSRTEINEELEAGSPVECHVGKGGILAMSPLLIHWSSKARPNQQRRVLHLEYASDLRICPGITLAIA